MMYDLSITNQLTVFLQSFGFGVFIGFSGDVLFFFSGLLTSKKKIRYIISDSILTLFFAFSFFCFIVSYNLGKVRLYVISGMFFGVLIYELSFAGVIGFISEKFLSVFKSLLSVIFKPIFSLKKSIGRKIRLKINKTHKKSNKCIAKKNNDVV